MSDVSSINAAPPPEAVLLRRPADAKPAKAADPAKRPAPAEGEATPVTLTNKTKLQVEKAGAFQFAYTFIDGDTGEVVAHWPRQAIYKASADANRPGKYLKALV